MKEQKKIVFIGFLPGFGGAEKSMIMISNGLAKLGYEVYVISLKDNNVVYEIDEKVKYIFIPDNKGTNLFKQINRFVNLKNKLGEIKPDLVISFWLQPSIFTVVLSKFIGFKTIYSERGDPTDKEYSGILGLLRSIFLRFVDGVVFQTQGAKGCFPKYIQNKGIVINNPVYIKYNDYADPKERRKAIVNVGRLHEQKNQMLLIDAFTKISNLFPEYTLEIYGDGDLKGKLSDRINELKLNDRIQLQGTTKQLFLKIIDASLFVLSSDYEGMPNALMEAMSLGIPSISTDCNPGGARELIFDTHNGLITARKSVNELADAMQYMLEHPGEAESMGRNAKEICITHSVDVIITIWEEYITRIIGRDS